MRLREHWLARQGGVVSRNALLAWGNTDPDIRRAIRGGDLVRVRTGWFGVPGADDEVVRAVRAGGALGCVSALRRHGVWTADRGHHVRFAVSDGRQAPKDWCRCNVPGVRRSPRAAVDDVPTALLSASRCQSREGFLVLLDSVVNLQLMEPDELQRLFVGASAEVRARVAQVDRAESGTETMVRHRLRVIGVRVRPQVEIPGIGRVDFLIGESLVLEIDSVAHHTSLENYRRDRARDLALQARGYRVVRLTYQQVLDDWPAAQAHILALMRRRAHRQRVAAA